MIAQLIFKFTPKILRKYFINFEPQTFTYYYQTIISAIEGHSFLIKFILNLIEAVTRVVATSSHYGKGFTQK